jgi:hypothetical protein
MQPQIPYNLYEAMFQTGSSIICDPPVTDTDIDFMIHSVNWNRLHKELIKQGYTYTGNDDYPEDDFRSYRKGVLNLIITPDINFFTRFKEATDVAKKLNLKEKVQRVGLFKYIVDGEL